MRDVFKFLSMCYFALMAIAPFSLAESQKDQERQILKIFEKYNSCETGACAKQFLDGVMLQQLASLKPESASEVLKLSRLSTYKHRVKAIGNFAAMYVSDYHFTFRPHVQGGVVVAYLFVMRDQTWKIYHRLPEKEVGADLKPISRP